MLKRTAPILAVALCILIARAIAQPAIQDSALKFYNSLSDEQKKQITQPFDAPDRATIKYEGGPRPGIHLKDLSPEQQKLAEEMITQFTSAYGKEKAKAIVDQKSNSPDPTTGFARLYVCFFGDPTKDKNYAWRVAEHHLTIVHVEVEDGHPKSFGPILLGANPPDLWDTEEEKMIALYAAMTPPERDKPMNAGKSNSSEAAKPGTKFIALADLNPTAKKTASELLELRLSFFADPIQQRIREQLEKAGGADALKLSFYGPAEKKCRDGGRWDFKMYNDAFLCDYENTRAHIHLSLKAQTR